MTMKQKQVNNEIDQSSSHDEQDLASVNDTERLTGKNPTPHERADLIVRRLENFIREGRTEDGGINFRKWQEMAVLEVANAIRDAEKYLTKQSFLIDELRFRSKLVADSLKNIISNNESLSLYENKNLKIVYNNNLSIAKNSHPALYDMALT